MLNLTQAYQAFLIAALFCFNTSGIAAQFQTFNNLEVHYIALTSTFLQPDIAQKYTIKRSKYNAIINISVLDKNAGNKAVSAVISGTGKNLLGQSHDLNFIEIKEGDAVYYIADYPFSNEEIVNFNITITAQEQTNTLKFQHKFYVD
ncbi:DUF4426 domain-containing protein [Psychromonas sp.]|uniref:DUF4426 domain-containing protein n=1 Tax=Psychromonas sp. TaxID=1884585 RepID=UPI00356703DD